MDGAAAEGHVNLLIPVALLHERDGRQLDQAREYELPLGVRCVDYVLLYIIRRI